MIEFIFIFVCFVFTPIYYLFPLYFLNKTLNENTGEKENKVKTAFSILLASFVLRRVVEIDNLLYPSFNEGTILCFAVYFLFIIEILYLNKEKLNKIYIKILLLLSVIFQFFNIYNVFHTINVVNNMDSERRIWYTRYTYNIMVQKIDKSDIITAIFFSIFLIPGVRHILKKLYEKLPEKIKENKVPIYLILVLLFTLIYDFIILKH